MEHVGERGSEGIAVLRSKQQATVTASNGQREMTPRAMRKQGANHECRVQCL
jgi:hypothetical protein